MGCLLTVHFKDVPDRSWDDSTQLVVRDLWKHADEGSHTGSFTAQDAIAALAPTAIPLQGMLSRWQAATPYLRFGWPPWRNSANLGFEEPSRLWLTNINEAFELSAAAAGMRVLPRRPLHCSWI